MLRIVSDEGAGDQLSAALHQRCDDIMKIGGRDSNVAIGKHNPIVMSLFEQITQGAVFVVNPARWQIDEQPDQAIAIHRL